MSAEQNKAIVLRMFEEAFNQRKPELADELVSPDFVDHTPIMGEPTGPAAFKYLYGALTRGMPDLRFSIEDSLAEADRVALRWVLSGTNTGGLAGRPPTNQPVEEHAIVIFRVVDGKITERWAGIDFRKSTMQGPPPQGPPRTG
jgi:predicted ester cyclase